MKRKPRAAPVPIAWASRERVLIPFDPSLLRTDVEWLNDYLSAVEEQAHGILERRDALAESTELARGMLDNLPRVRRFVARLHPDNDVPELWRLVGLVRRSEGIDQNDRLAQLVASYVSSRRKPSVTDEQIAAAVAKHRTQVAAAEELGISTRRVRERRPRAVKRKSVRPPPAE